MYLGGLEWAAFFLEGTVGTVGKFQIVSPACYAEPEAPKLVPPDRWPKDVLPGES